MVNIAMSLTPSEYPFGFVTIAMGHTSYGEMACDMVLSLREYHADPVFLIADEANADWVGARFPGLFERVIRAAPLWGRADSVKFRVAELVPVERGFFIDADTFVLAPLDDHIGQTASDDLVMMAHDRRADRGGQHHGFDIRELCDFAGVDRFLDCHSGAFGYRRDGAAALLAAGAAMHRKLIDRYGAASDRLVGDELAFGLVGADRGVARFDAGDPVLWPDEMATLDPALTPKPLCHVYTAPRERAFAHLLRGAVARRKDAGYPTDGCAAVWRRKPDRNRRRGTSLPVRAVQAGVRAISPPRHTRAYPLPEPIRPLPPARAPFGFVTIAMKGRDYAEMAVDMLLSLRAFHDDPVCLVADDICADIVEAEYPGLFDHVSRICGDNLVGHAAKFHLAECTPYDRALFIDADILVVGDLTIFKRQTGVEDMFMMGHFRRPEVWSYHHLLSIRKLCRAFGLSHFFASHSAFFGFQRHQTRGFFAEAKRIYLDELFRRPWLRRGMVGDEICFGVVGGRYGMARMVTPYPVMWNKDLKALTPGRPTGPLAHFHAAPSPDGLDWLMDGVIARREAAGLALGSDAAWRRKSARSEARRNIRTLYDRIADGEARLRRRVRGLLAVRPARSRPR